jgi:beta-glucuronidase
MLDLSTVKLNGIWDFTFIPAGQEFSVNEVTFDTLAAVPGCFDLMPDYFLQRGTGVYRRLVNISGKVDLTFEGIGLRANIYWDKKLIKTIEVSFAKEIIRFNAGNQGEHELIVAVNNEFDDTPSSMHGRLYDFYAHGGIYRDVSISLSKKVFVEYAKIIPTNIETKEVELSLALGGEVENITSVAITFDDNSQTYTLPINNAKGKATFIVPNGKLWSPESPNLHQMNISIDSYVFTYQFGIRSIQAKEGKIYLNNKPIKIAGYNRHDAHPDFGYAAPLETRLRDLMLVKKQGANCIRGCHYPQSEEFLSLCDKMGILVWEESLGWGNCEASLIDEKFQAHQIRETQNMALKSVNHPSVIFWGFLNEASTHLESARPLVSSLVKVLKEVDSTRLITFGSNKLQKDCCLDLVDVISFNTYPGWYCPSQEQFMDKVNIENHLKELEDFASQDKYKDKPLLISEIGAEAMPGLKGGHRWTEEYQAKLLETVADYTLNNSRYSGFFMWQFCDTRTYISNGSQVRSCGFNFKGVLDRHRVPKEAWYSIGRVIKNYLNKGE